jgi:hypothetical protein
VTRVREELVQAGVLARIVILGLIAEALLRVWPDTKRAQCSTPTKKE